MKKMKWPFEKMEFLDSSLETANCYDGDDGDDGNSDGGDADVSIPDSNDNDADRDSSCDD
jgi:hypothetical protein